MVVSTAKPNWVWRVVFLLLIVCALPWIFCGIWSRRAEERFSKALASHRVIESIEALYYVEFFPHPYPDRFSDAVEFCFDPVKMVAAGRSGPFTQLPVNPYTNEPVKEVILDGQAAWGDYLYIKFIDAGEIVHGDVFCFLPETRRQKPRVMRYGHCGMTEDITAIIGLRPDDFFHALQNPDSYEVEVNLDDDDCFEFVPEEWRIDEANRALVKIKPVEDR